MLKVRYNDIVGRSLVSIADVDGKEVTRRAEDGIRANFDLLHVARGNRHGYAPNMETSCPLGGIASSATHIFRAGRTRL